MKDYKKEYERLKTKQDFRHAVYVTMFYVVMIVVGIMR